jgi:hypothetical protein
MRRTTLTKLGLLSAMMCVTVLAAASTSYAADRGRGGDDGRGQTWSHDGGRGGDHDRGGDRDWNRGDHRDYGRGGYYYDRPVYYAPPVYYSRPVYYDRPVYVIERPYCAVVTRGFGISVGW